LFCLFRGGFPRYLCLKPIRLDFFLRLFLRSLLRLSFMPSYDFGFASPVLLSLDSCRLLPLLHNAGNIVLAQIARGGAKFTLSSFTAIFETTRACTA